MAKVAINDPEYWRERAKEARALAGRLAHDLLLRRRMLKVAADYDELTKRAEQRLRRADEGSGKERWR